MRVYTVNCVSTKLGGGSLIAHFRGDEGAFRAAAWEIVENEKRVKRSIAASELERILNDANAYPKRDLAGTLYGVNGASSSPKDKDKNAPLLDTIEPQRSLEHLVLSEPTRSGLDRVVAEWKKDDVLRAYGLQPVSKLLFHGPPGCGKNCCRRGSG